MQTYNVRTAHGTVHQLTDGRTYTLRGYQRTNRIYPVGQQGPGKADCGALTSTAAHVTTDPVSCSKCIDRMSASTASPAAGVPMSAPNKVPLVDLYYLGNGEYSHALRPGTTDRMRCGARIRSDIDRYVVRTGQPSCEGCYQSLARDAVSKGPR